MTPSRFNSSSARRGIAAFALVMLLALLSISIAGLVIGGARDQDMAIARMDTERAFYCAEAGMSMGYRESFVGSDLDGDGGIGSISDDGDAGNNPRIGSASVLVTRQGTAASRTLIARASAGSSTHRIESDIGPDTDGAAPGLVADYFISASPVGVLSDIDWDATPDASTIVSQINFAETSGQSWPGGPTNNWGRRYTGKVTVAQSGSWTFHTNSDDGSDVWINGVRIVNNDGQHAMQSRNGVVTLAAGAHDIEVRWFERTGDFGLILSWSGPGVASPAVIPASALTH